LGWNYEEAELELRDPDDPSQPYSAGDPYITLMSLEPRQAYGLALDGNRLYVSNNTTTVHYYDTSSWAHIDTRDVGRKAADLAIDPDNGEHNAYLYIGSLYDGCYNFGHPYLVKHDLEADPNVVNPNTEQRIEDEPDDTVAIGLGVDPNSGLVYVGTSDYKIRVYDCSEPTFVCTYSVDTGGSSGPAGICVPKGDASFVLPFTVEKIDDVSGCVSPREQEITYTINFDYQWAGHEDPCIFDTIKLRDYLPAGVDFVSASDNGELNRKIITWEIDTNTLEPDSVELTVQVNKMVSPGGTIKNNVEIIATIGVKEYVGKFTLQTSVCDCSEYGRIIHVDADVSVQDPNGATWNEAFGNLQDALAVTWPCDEVWVADGTYKPVEGTDPNLTFQLINGLGVYGGFEGTEEERSDRNWADPCKEAILSGDIAGDENSYYVVVSDANSVLTILDGFTITGGGIAGVYCEEGSPVIQHNKIMTSGVGIYCKNTEQPVIKNNWIYRNDYGMYFDNPGDKGMVRNNTVVYNDEVGIFYESGIKPMITNCILWGNGDESIEKQLNWDYMEGLFVQYSCIQNSNDVTPQPPYYTINTDPCFAYDDPNDYHLVPDSPCIDAGDPAGDYTGERGIDKHFRVLDGNDDGDKRLDMGADEYCNQGTDNVADFNDDDIVDTDDLIELAGAWLIYFAKEWLWMTCDMMQGYEMMEMMMGMGGGESMLMAKAESLSPATQKEESSKPSEPSVEEQIEQVKYLLDWLYEIKDEVDEDTWLDLATTLEEMLKELEKSK